MPEKLPDKTVYSLTEVARSIQRTIADRYQRSYWIKAEMNRLNHYAHSGHCYPELVEKKDGKIITEMRAVLWNNDYERINRRFLETVREPLQNGITILFLATISFDPLYGLSLRILDIDPTFALGALEQEKQACIARLRQEGLFDANKRLPFPLIPKRVAVISVETSKGYADFLKILDGNPWGYRFEHTLFPALLQGDKSVPSIINQLAAIAERLERFDVVAIIRGGGGEVGLTSYNHYLLASAIAKFPLPVITGIGHATNETVSELVAHHNAITPTGLANFLLQCFHNAAVPLAEAQQTITDHARQLLDHHRRTLSDGVRYFRLNTRNVLNQQYKKLEFAAGRLTLSANGLVRQERHALMYPQQALCRACASRFRQATADLDGLRQQVHLLDPQQVLNRGYSITRLNGRALSRVDGNVKSGDVLETVLAAGTITSVVTESKQTP